MKIFVKGILLSLFFPLSVSVMAGRGASKFVDISEVDFSPSAYAIDSSASGIVLFDVGSSTYEGDTHGGFSIIFKRHTRIRLINRNSFDLATITIPLYSAGSLEETVDKLEASTYNLENGKVEKYSLDKTSIFTDRLNKNYTRKKFTLPNLKEGSIIEIKYTLKSPYERDLRSWTFQRPYPVLYSEYNVTIPYFYDFVTIEQGYHPYAVDTVTTENASYNIVDVGNFSTERTRNFSVRTTNTTHMWAMKNVPALKEESFTTTIDNHISRLEFQLSKIRYPDLPVKDVMTNWITVSEDLMKDASFGESLTNVPGWMNTEVKRITEGAATGLDAAHKIYDFVRDNISCSDYSATHLSSSLKKVYQSRHGNVADINLLLTAFMLSKGFDAHPVLLSTRDNGRAMEIYPVLDKMNYVVCQTIINGKTYLLDASHNKTGFGHIPLDCYNGYARVVDKVLPVPVDLSADSIRETKATSVFIINDEKGGFSGAFTSNLGDFESQRLREKIAKTSKEDFLKELKKNLSFDVDMSDASIDSLKSYEEPVAVKFNFKFDANDDIIYLNPIFEGAYKENPFKAAERHYPVEMPYTMNETFILNMDIPKGYAVEEIPKSTRVKLNENEGMFEYLIAKDENAIQLRSTLKLNKALFEPEDYQTLRDFFAYIVKKHSEQIVFKKIKYQ